jgi:putative transcriptional regulator
MILLGGNCMEVKWKRKVKGKRIENGIKQQDFAKMLGISKVTLVRIEKGEVEPRRDLMLRIANILGEDVKELFF